MAVKSFDGIAREWKEVQRRRAPTFAEIIDNVQDALAAKGVAPKIKPPIFVPQLSERTLDDVLAAAEEAREALRRKDPRLFQETAERILRETIDRNKLCHTPWVGLGPSSYAPRQFFALKHDQDGVITKPNVNGLVGSPLSLLDIGRELGLISDAKWKVIDETLQDYSSVEKNPKYWEKRKVGGGWPPPTEELERRVKKWDRALESVLPNEYEYDLMCEEMFRRSADDPTKGLINPDYVSLCTMAALYMDVREIGITSGSPADFMFETLGQLELIVNGYLGRVDGAPRVSVHFQGTVINYPAPDKPRVRLNLVTRKPDLARDQPNSRVLIYESLDANAANESSFATPLRIMAGHFLDHPIIRRPALALSRLRRRIVRKDVFVSDNKSDSLYARRSGMPFLFVNVKKEDVAAKLGYSAHGVEKFADALRYIDFEADVGECVQNVGYTGLVEMLLWYQVLRDPNLEQEKSLAAAAASLKRYGRAPLTRPFHLILAELQNLKSLKDGEGQRKGPSFVGAHPFYHMSGNELAELAEIYNGVRDLAPKPERAAPPTIPSLYYKTQVPPGPPIAALYAAGVRARSDTEFGRLEEWAKEKIARVRGQGSRSAASYARAMRRDTQRWRELLPNYSAVGAPGAP